MGTDSIADDLLRNGYERWLRLEEAKAEVSDDIKELMAELKGHGFTPKAVRESFRRVRDLNDADKQEHDAIVDLYVASLTRARPAPAHAREAESIKKEKKRDAVDWDEMALREYPDDSPVRVYFIEAPSLGLIKIGSTGKVHRRVSAIQRATPVPTSLIGVIAGGTKREVELHKKYAAHRVHGEWFAEIIKPELEAILASEALVDSAPPHDPETGELTDNQESGAVSKSGVLCAVSPASDESETDDVGATASSPYSNPKPTKGESDAKSAHDDSVFEEHLIDRRRQDAARAERQQPIGHENAPVESAADTISTTNPNSQRPLAVKSAGEAGSSSLLTSPATNPDDDIPTFLRRDLVEA